MDYSKLLNEKQLEAVTTDSQYVRIIAGAGSGKTRVLTYRISFLIGEMNVQPNKILAIAFTNKVAKEMRERAEKLVPDSIGAKISTFHSFCNLILREDIHRIGMIRNFSILDEDDQLKMMKHVAQGLGYAKSDEIIRQTLGYLHNHKTEGRYPQDVTITDHSFVENEKAMHELWTAFEAEKDRQMALDFDDLLLRANQLLRLSGDVRRKWQNRFEHILIDEFQDTNNVQYELVKLLLKPSTALYVVGDPDQTIYTWRGANQEILIDMQKRYPSVETIILARNYRSTKTILRSANTLIANNRNRIKKDLYTENEEGEAVKIHDAHSAEDEADWVIENIYRKMVEADNFKYRQVAILFRAAYLTRVVEMALIRRQIPYKMYGGTPFYQRKEIKDVLAYWKLLANHRDNISFERIINVPRRNIGETSFEVLQKEAMSFEYSIYDYILLKLDYETTDLRRKVVDQLKDLVATMETFRLRIDEGNESFSQTLRDYLTAVGYFDYLDRDEEAGEERRENVEELFNEVHTYIKGSGNPSFSEFLQKTLLSSSQDEITDGDFVTLMTIHVAKGLEFPYVFVVGVNEGVFPSDRALAENGYRALEEERRLCYVAFTRAEKQLFVSCNRAYSFVIKASKVPSRFFKEAGLEIRKTARWSHTTDDTPIFTDRAPDVQKVVEKPNTIAWEVGNRVQHRVFGLGEVKEIIDNKILVVNFDSAGIKQILANHPTLTKVLS